MNIGPDAQLSTLLYVWKKVLLWCVVEQLQTTKAVMMIKATMKNIFFIFILDSNVLLRHYLFANIVFFVIKRWAGLLFALCFWTREFYGVVRFGGVERLCYFCGCKSGACRLLYGGCAGEKGIRWESWTDHAAVCALVKVQISTHYGFLQAVGRVGKWKTAGMSQKTCQMECFKRALGN